MFLSRSTKSSSADKKAKSDTQSAIKTNDDKMHLESFLTERDYTGALTLLEYDTTAGQTRSNSDLWQAYCYFKLGEYKQALHVYERLRTIALKSKSSKEDAIYQEQLITYIAVCDFWSGEYERADEGIRKLTSASNNDALIGLQRRLRLHLAERLANEEQLKKAHESLKDVVPDQLSLAAVHWLRAHHQDAIDIYKKCLLEQRDLNALSAYLALCYFKLDYFDVSQEVLAAYLGHCDGDSLIAINLKACNHYRLYNGRAAENELRQLMDNCSPSFTFGKQLIRHNLVVFRNGEMALQVLPPLVDLIPEARLNLAIYQLRQQNVAAALKLLETMQPNAPYEYVLKAVVNAVYGQSLISNNRLAAAEHLKVAQQFFQLVGSSASECDTIPGRQCMASYFFLTRQFDDVLLYLNSIKSYFYSDDVFNFNFGQAKCAKNCFKEAEEALLLIKDENITNDPIYVCWLIRCYIMNKNPKSAWDLYDVHQHSTNEAFNYLVLIANDCYKMGFFLYSAKAFHELEQIDNNEEYVEGKRGACCGVFQLIIAGKEDRQKLSEIVHLLRTPPNAINDQIVKEMKTWNVEHRSQ